MYSSECSSAQFQKLSVNHLRSKKIQACSAMVDSLQVLSGQVTDGNGNPITNNDSYLAAVSVAKQGLNASGELQVTFEILEKQSNISIAANGDITFARSGLYKVDLSFNVFNDISGNIFFYLKQNGVVVHNSGAMSTWSTSTFNRVVTLSFHSFIDAHAGDVLSVFMDVSNAHIGAIPSRPIPSAQVLISSV